MEVIKLEKCPVCGGTGWEDLDYLRDHNYWEENDYLQDDPIGFKVCKGCGFLTYDYRTDAELKRRYEMIRPVISSNNLLTQGRKLEYHRIFLNKHAPDVFKGKRHVLDYGCSIGSFLDWSCRQILSGDGLDRIDVSDYVHGTEMNDSSRRVAQRHYGLKDVAADMDGLQYKGKFGLIALYHVFEHLQNPDKILAELSERLEDDGYLYIAVPEYLNLLEEASGSVCNDFENLYHLNHVNCFSEQSLRNILAAGGFKIVAYEKLYGMTVLVRKSGKALPIVKESYKTVTDILTNQKKAVDAYNKKDYKSILKYYQKYPDAYIQESGKMENFKDFKRIMALMDAADSACGPVSRLIRHRARILFQWDESKKGHVFFSDNVRRAEELLLHLRNQYGGDEDTQFILALIAGKYRNDYALMASYFDESLAINPSRWVECNNLRMGFMSQE